MVLPYQRIKALARGQRPAIRSTSRLNERQFQPASLDCTLGRRVYRVASSFLPRESETIAELLKTRTLYDFDLKPGSILEINTPYIIPLNESLALPGSLDARANPKSSIGRIDVFVRVLTDHNPQYDYITPGYKGPLYLEVIPLTFAIRVAPGLAMTQVRFRSTDDRFPTEAEMVVTHKKFGLITDNHGQPVPRRALRLKDNVISFSVDLTGSPIVAYRARHYVSELLDLTKRNHYHEDHFWTPVRRQPDGEIMLEPNSFYIMATKERVRIPPTMAAEIMPYDPSTGELRSHYAGFFDPGFGYSVRGKRGNIVVLEVRAHSAPFRLTDGQVICKMLFEKMAELPAKLYGSNIGSTYTSARIRLSKFFKR
ncbi:MAG: 2'-deoxycytidine 5'-triphosphate deaminase [Parcubacteria group bacterium GW2011_GWA2_46_9]|nr:MAG: 2'-deoxycytidine 5'-triphosphate deaminase [Parcubacteria group bacterium GW2011_GWA2_46_9]